MNTKTKFVLQTQEAERPGTRIKVIGVGGGGSNAVNHMAAEAIEGVQYYVANTDAQALSSAENANRIQFGYRTTHGLGTGFDPAKGKAAAMEDKQKLMESVGDAELLYITAGMGGGTGTGAAPVIAQAVKEVNPQVLVVAIVTMPFSFEGARRMRFAESGVKELKACVDSLISISNDKILSDDVPLDEAYSAANDVLLDAVRGIADMVMNAGIINVDFADIQTVMSASGTTMLGEGRASGEGRAKAAVESALYNPMLGEFDIADARRLLVNVKTSTKISSKEFKEIGEVISSAAPQAASFIPGLMFDEQFGDEICVTVIASATELPAASENGHAQQRGEEQDSLESAPAAVLPPVPEQIELERSQADDSADSASLATSGNGLHADEEEFEDEPMPEYVPSILRRRGEAATGHRQHELAEL